MPAVAVAPPSTTVAADLATLPGHQIRRLQQIAVGLFIEETAGYDVTPVQYATLATVARQPGLDQRTLARSVGFDTSTVAGVIDRLERRGLLRRQPAPEDRRVRQLALTAAGAALLERVDPAMRRAQARILSPLPEADRRRFMALLGRLVAANNGASRAPSEPA
jgi:DNA-binding MarR family transcriptional regulator